MDLFVNLLPGLGAYMLLDLFPVLRIEPKSFKELVIVYRTPVSALFGIDHSTVFSI